MTIQRTEQGKLVGDDVMAGYGPALSVELNETQVTDAGLELLKGFARLKHP